MNVIFCVGSISSDTAALLDKAIIHVDQLRGVMRSVIPCLPATLLLSFSAMVTAKAFIATTNFRSRKLSDLYQGDILILAQQSTAAQNSRRRHSCKEPPPACKSHRISRHARQ